MNRSLFTTIILGLLIIVLVFLFLQVSRVNKATAAESGRLRITISQLEDTLETVRLTLDSLKAQAPGLGEYMSTVQLQMSKLWFASHASNWDLAKYELDEMEETIAMVERLRAFKDSVNITSVLESVRQTQLPALGKSIEEKHLPSFKLAYNETISACNGCHRSSGYGFIHIISPTGEPVANQRWKAR